MWAHWLRGNENAPRASTGKGKGKDRSQDLGRGSLEHERNEWPVLIVTAGNNRLNALKAKRVANVDQEASEETQHTAEQVPSSDTAERRPGNKKGKGRADDLPDQSSGGTRAGTSSYRRPSAGAPTRSPAPSIESAGGSHGRHPSSSASQISSSLSVNAISADGENDVSRPAKRKRTSGEVSLPIPAHHPTVSAIQSYRSEVSRDLEAEDTEMDSGVEGGLEQPVENSQSTEDPVARLTTLMSQLTPQDQLRFAARATIVTRVISPREWLDIYGDMRKAQPIFFWLGQFHIRYQAEEGAVVERGGRLAWTPVEEQRVGAQWTQQAKELVHLTGRQAQHHQRYLSLQLPHPRDPILFNAPMVEPVTVVTGGEQYVVSNISSRMQSVFAQVARQIKCAQRVWLN